LGLELHTGTGKPYEKSSTIATYDTYPKNHCQVFFSGVIDTICPPELTNGMSALRGPVIELHRRREDEDLQRSRNGPDDESARRDLTSSGETDHVVASGGGFRDQ
jgi:hypothetical protein